MNASYGSRMLAFKALEFNMNRSHTIPLATRNMCRDQVIFQDYDDFTTYTKILDLISPCYG